VVTASDNDEPALPAWTDGTVLILVTAGEPPHVIPVSAAVRAGEWRVVLALAQGRDSLRRLRADPRVALAINAAGDVAVTAYGTARVRSEDLAEGVAAVEIIVEHVQDHNRATFVIDSGVAWHWTDAEARERDAGLRRALRGLAEA
jgi:hypothetical protein